MSACSWASCQNCGMCTESWEREEDDERDERVYPVTVRVETRPDGYRAETFIGYTADSYRLGELTITANQTGFERVFHANEWLHATAYDERGNILFNIDNPYQPAA